MFRSLNPRHKRFDEEILVITRSSGKRPFKEVGLNFLYDIIKNNIHLYGKTLPNNTLYYIEEYVFFYMNNHIDMIQADISLKRKVVKGLDFLVSKGSTMGFLLKQELI